MKNRILVIGLIIVGFFALIAIFAPLISSYPPDAIDQNNLLAGPSGKHWLGTESLGRDIYSRIVYCARISLTI